MSNKNMLERRVMFGAVSLLLFAWATVRFGIEPVEAARISDIRGTKHNLSAAYSDGSNYTLRDGSVGTVPTRAEKATSTATGSEICVFCHTPHGATNTVEPLWNRRVAGNGYVQSYSMYTSSTLDALQIQVGGLDQPGGSSKLCLSCHDGTVAVGNVNVLNGKATNNADKTVQNITMASQYMPAGAGTGTGFTRSLGVDLTNDHPISLTYNSTLAGYDGELRSPPATDSNGNTLAALRTKTVKPKLPLEDTNGATQIQCATCHDPHIRETSEATVGNQKFLRLNRFQELNPPSTSGFVSTDNAGDIICLACHDKNNGYGSWAYSAHANPLVADETYSTVATASSRRDFPTNQPVWKAACLNCHDTHTVTGANRLLREGTNENTTTDTLPKAGGAGTAAQEEACYQCHDGGTNKTLNANTSVPNIKGDFNLSYRMPITTAAQGTSGGGGGNTTEVHDISSAFSSDGIMTCSTGDKCGKDFIEPRSKLGVANLKNRHVECTDCHNPHRVIRGDTGLPGVLNSTNTSVARVNGASGGHHKHTDDAATSHTNVISGVLRGTWGVEPSYTSASFASLPSGYTVKRGDPGFDTLAVSDCAGANKATCNGKTYVTREYQICLKCHSDYGYSDDNLYPNSATGKRPQLGGTNLTGNNPSGHSNFTTYTNQAKEFQAPSTHRGEVPTTDSGAGAAWQDGAQNNHRSWHPVMDSTNRDTAARGGLSATNWLQPWQNNLGGQTMYCTDCHGSVTTGTTVIPDSTNPWGPHGSGKPFILKGDWTNKSGSNNTADANTLCFKCHKESVYGTGDGTRTGFWISSGNSSSNDGHKVHAKDRIGYMRCNWCHVAVPHGWKNKALLVNLNDLGPEVGFGSAGGVQFKMGGDADAYTNGPYYRNAKLKIVQFRKSGDWVDTACGTVASTTYTGTATNTTGSGKDYMKSVCKSPP